MKKKCYSYNHFVNGNKICLALFFGWKLFCSSCCIHTISVYDIKTGTNAYIHNICWPIGHRLPPSQPAKKKKKIQQYHVCEEHEKKWGFTRKWTNMISIKISLNNSPEEKEIKKFMKLHNILLLVLQKYQILQKYLLWLIYCCLLCVFLLIHRYWNLLLCMYGMGLHLSATTIFLGGCLLAYVPVFTDTRFLWSFLWIIVYADVAPWKTTMKYTNSFFKKKCPN